MLNVIEHNGDQQRNATNLENVYSVWIEAERASFQYRYRWKTSKNIDYLYKIQNGGSNVALSLGPRSAETEEIYNRETNYEVMAKNSANRALLLGRMYKASKLPTILPFAGSVLRSLDRHKFLGDIIQVVGTTAIAAYELEAQCSFVDPKLKATEDLDLTWREDKGIFDRMMPPLKLIDVIKESDATWTISSENTFRLINKDAEIVELLIPPSLWETRPKGAWMAVQTPGQEDLVGGLPVDYVVADMSGRPARIVAPDPRLFMLHKWIIAKNETQRKPAKLAKDEKQALQLRDLIIKYMPAHPLDKDFIGGLNERLRQAWDSMPKNNKKQIVKPW